MRGDGAGGGNSPGTGKLETYQFGTGARSSAAERSAHNRLVVGSNPAGPITNDFLHEVLNLKGMMEVLLGTVGRRKLRLQSKSNSELFLLYAGELAVRHRSAAALKEAKRLLGHFETFLGSNPPASELATSFLARFSALTSNTMYRYHSIINSFMTWYGERLESKVKVPKTLPQYIEDVEVEKLKDALRQNLSHKGVIERNLLLVDLMANTGLRREEVANLKIGDIDFQRQYLVVRHGKGPPQIEPGLHTKVESSDVTGGTR